jgi:glyoxylase-like metal-dependent hydrolase (beta-lactamase superfamily II)
LLDELDLKLFKAIDTHVHADHITGLGALRDRTKCVTILASKAAMMWRPCALVMATRLISKVLL